MKDDQKYIDHIFLCLDRIAKYTEKGRDEFLSNTMIQDAVIRNLQTLAESTQRASEAFRARCPEIDWKSIAGFRNVLVHQYLGLELTDIWNVVVEDLPALRKCLERIRRES